MTQPTTDFHVDPYEEWFHQIKGSILRGRGGPHLPRGWPQLSGPEPPTPADAAALARIFNDLALEITAESPRLLSFCQVSLRDPDLSCGVDMVVFEEARPVGALVRASFLAEDERNLLPRGNATTWLGLDQMVAAS
ncbi:hypothetical protein SMD20_43435 [Nonomuraea sp. LP-02]|uniref:hypothetical protein n=1 Tax=Nonomuraea sp. LP-02 TaxID=3097960 RepID=UPI002E2F2D5C|nr:hypothetical protein [Nonomuraea sp. LP-02]MED7931138.1 hypothetical protein [Nonomuraea sp. LP-02]